MTQYLHRDTDQKLKYCDQLRLTLPGAMYSDKSFCVLVHGFVLLSIFYFFVLFCFVLLFKNC